MDAQKIIIKEMFMFIKSRLWILCCLVIISTLIHPVDRDYLLFRNHDVGMSRQRHCLMREQNVKGASPSPTHFLCMVARD